MKISNSMKKLEDIEAYLGFNDDRCRSSINWCRRHKIPLFSIGKATYASEHMFEQVITRIIRNDCFKEGIDGDAVITAIENDDKVALAEIMNLPVAKKVERVYSKEQEKKKSDFANIISTDKKKTA